MSDFLTKTMQRAAADLQTIVLPEGNDQRTIDAAIQVAKQGIARLIVVSREALPQLEALGVQVVDPEAWEEVNRLFKIYLKNWSKLGSQITGRQIIENLSEQNRQIARLAAFKLSDAEIGARMNMSISGVKQAIRIIKQKSGLERSEFAAIL